MYIVACQAQKAPSFLEKVEVTACAMLFENCTSLEQAERFALEKLRALLPHHVNHVAHATRFTLENQDFEALRQAINLALEHDNADLALALTSLTNRLNS